MSIYDEVKTAPEKGADKYLIKAKRIVADQYSESAGSIFSPNEFYIVWFSKVLQNWKALVSTDLEPGVYYEVTYNGDREEAYVDFYTKLSSVAVTDHPTTLPIHPPYDR